MYREKILYRIYFEEADGRLVDDERKELFGWFIREYRSFYDFKTVCGYHVSVWKDDVRKNKAQVEEADLRNLPLRARRALSSDKFLKEKADEKLVL